MSFALHLKIDPENHLAMPNRYITIRLVLSSAKFIGPPTVHASRLTELIELLGDGETFISQ